jgi:two-component system sensor histidine kinase RegB
MRHSFIADTLASTPSIQLSWLVKLRWRAVLGQMVTIAVVFLYLDVTVPLRPLALLIALTVATNLLVVWRLSLGEIAS